MTTPCEDFPCGRDQYGQPDCPDTQGRFRCVECGKRLSKNATNSICPRCATRRRRMIDHGYDDVDYNMNH